MWFLGKLCILRVVLSRKSCLLDSSLCRRVSNSDSVDLQTVGVTADYDFFPFWVHTKYRDDLPKARWRTSLSTPRGKWIRPTSGENGLKRHSVHGEPRRSVMKRRQNPKSSVMSKSLYPIFFISTHCILTLTTSVRQPIHMVCGLF